jgi:hypothetical protein
MVRIGKTKVVAYFAVVVRQSSVRTNGSQIAVHCDIGPVPGIPTGYHPNG